MRHEEAAQVLSRAFQKIAGRAPTDSELGYCQAVAWLETFYGRGGQFAKLFDRGMVNWGALERAKDGSGSCPAGTASGSDVGQVCFFVYPSDDEACEAFLAVLLTGSRTAGRPVMPMMTQAMTTGTPLDVAQAMKTQGYFGAPVSDYAQAIATSLGVIARPGGITDQGVRFTTADPPPGAPPQTSSAPGAKPGGPWYTRPAAKVGFAAVAAAGIFVLARRVL